jgi:D-sedoheptulose 7-phosphate isomerase
LEHLNQLIGKYDELISLITKDRDSTSVRITTLAAEVTQCLVAGGTLAFVGNGGSAAEAIHLAAEFTGHCVVDHKPLKAVCLNESQSAITAIANDYGFEFTFSRLVEAYLSEGDVLILLSTSGTSRNITNAIQSALVKKLRIILWTGLSAPEIEGVDVWRAPSISTPRIQELHLFWGHTLAEIVESHFQG